MGSLWRRDIRFGRQLRRIIVRFKSGKQYQSQEKSQLQIMSEKFHKPGAFRDKLYLY